MYCLFSAGKSLVIPRDIHHMDACRLRYVNHDAVLLPVYLPRMIYGLPPVCTAHVLIFHWVSAAAST